MPSSPGRRSNPAPRVGVAPRSNGVAGTRAFPNGVWEREARGEEAGYRALKGIDSYQAVKDGTAYPAVLLTTGVTDPRVAPFHVAKMAARLQAASTSGKPILLRHGVGSTRAQQDREVADTYAFLLWRTGASAKTAVAATPCAICALGLGLLVTNAAVLPARPVVEQPFSIFIFGKADRTERPPTPPPRRALAGGLCDCDFAVGLLHRWRVLHIASRLLQITHG